MKDLVIFGAGKVADVLYAHMASTGDYNVAAFTCDPQFAPPSGHFHDKPVLPFDDIEKHYPPDRYGMIIALGYHELNALRREKFEHAKRKGFRLASYVSPRAGTGDWLAMGENCIVLDNAVIEPGVRLGNNVVVWSGVLVGHHSTVEDHVWLAGQAVLGGSTKIGAGTFVGLGAIIGHEVELGERSFLGAGTVVTKCSGPKSVFVGKSTELYRLDSERFLRISKLR